MTTAPIPEGYHTVTPYLVVAHAAALIEFAQKAFAATEVHRVKRPDGTVAHAEIKIGDSRVMLADASGQWKAMPSALFLYFADCDAMFQSAVAAGATPMMQPADQHHGDRMGGVLDTNGNFWWLATRRENLAPEELQRRADAQFKK
jgi:PhnB protein